MVGVSYGAFALANAAPQLPWVRSIALESPYPNFNAWYPGGVQRAAIELFDRAFPRSARYAQADRNIARALPERILVCLAEDDDVTPPDLTAAVARAAPQGRTTLVRVPRAKHLEPFAKSEEYRRALLRCWRAGRAMAPTSLAS
ncbi:MAG TPA: hypothetical protein VM582_06845 [Candidatus Thermoplasmatota archaeon]|nr:hypothetical protein [Candidatus Thermoplasmatota archaeon]